jgi:hypothetical protein
LPWYRSEIWSLTLRGEQRLRLLENRELRRVFGPKRGRKWQEIGEICIMRASPNIVEEDEMMRSYSTHGRDEKCIQNFGRKT